MRKIKYKLLTFFLFLFITVGTSSAAVSAMSLDAIHFNTDEGYEVVIDDQADYLSPDQEAELSKVMIETGKYGNVVFITTDNSSYNTAEAYAVDYFEERYGDTSSGVVFIVDMDNREIYLMSEGNLRKSLTNSRCTSITDNTYRYATEAGGRNFYKCAYKTFEQVNKALTGKFIFTPMRFICAALLALIIAMLINYRIAKSYSKPAKASDKVLLNSMAYQINIANARAQKTNSTKTYSPRSSSSGSSGGHSGGGRSGGGGGHSGGGHSGGGHRI